jgi:hypothetical protein
MRSTFCLRSRILSTVSWRILSDEDTGEPFSSGHRVRGTTRAPPDPTDLFLVLHPSLRERIDRSGNARQQIAAFRILNADYFPRESHLVTFRDPWSFPVLFHPACNNLVKTHLEELAQKIVSVCVSLGEYPMIRFYRPRAPTHEASVLCTHLARFVQEELDTYAQYHQDFPPQSNRPRGALYITDRSMDVHAPFIHEFTYQAMAHDLLPIKDGEKVTFKTLVNEGQPDEEEKDMEIGEKDKIWVDNRHRHMKDTIEKLMGDFQRFIDENPHFTNAAEDGGNSLNAIKDMLAGLPEFQEMKGAYSLHLSMAQDCMNIFQHNKLPDLASVEQVRLISNELNVSTDESSLLRLDWTKIIRSRRTWQIKWSDPWMKRAFGLRTVFDYLLFIFSIEMAYCQLMFESF